MQNYSNQIAHAASDSSESENGLQVGKIQTCKKAKKKSNMQKKAKFSVSFRLFVGTHAL
jgi:hypothetical protein